MTKQSDKIAFAFFQTSQLADGGVKSASVLLEHLNTVRPLIITQLNTPLTKKLRDKGYSVHLLSTRREPGVSLWAQGFWRGVLDFGRVFSSNFWCAGWLLKNGIRTIHCNDILAFLYLGFGAKLVGAKLIFVLRRSFPKWERLSWKHRLAFLLANKIITLSAEMTSTLRKEITATSSSKIIPIYSGVDREHYYAVDQIERGEIINKLGLTSNTINVGYIGSIQPRKGQLEFLLNIGARLEQEIPQLKLYFIGSTLPVHRAYQQQCFSLRNSLHLEELCYFIGEVEDMADWYRALDFVVLASQSEGLARVMLESLAVGTPIISFAVSSAREIIERHGCGIVVEPDNYAQLFNAIAELSFHPEKRQALGDNALRTANYLFDANRQAASFEKVYR